MADTQITLDDIARAQKRGLGLLRFEKPVERLFVADYAAARTRLVPLWALLGSLFYALAATGDVSMLPDVSHLLLVFRFGIFIPVAVLTVVCVKLWPRPGVYDGFSLLIGILGTALPMTGLVFTESAYAFVYQTGSVCTFLYFTVVLRTRFLTTLLGILAMCVIQFTTTALNGSFDEVTYSGIVSFYVTLSVFLIMGSYFLERNERQNFLHRLRGTVLQDQLRHKSEHDELSGLRNRRSLAASVKRLWQTGAAADPVSVILIDVDNFKLYNDVAGHLEGDRCLRAVSDAIAGRVADRGIVFRFGGEEILVLLPGSAARRAHALAEELRGAVEALALFHPGLGEGRVVTISLGTSSGTLGGTGFKEVLSAADAALYEAKGAGRNTVRSARPDTAGRPSDLPRGAAQALGL